MKRLLVIGLSLACLAARAEVVDIDNAELARLTTSGVPVIDIRTAGEWQETGIVPGSKLLTFFDERGNSDAPAWIAKARAIAKPDQPVILICRSGNRTQAVSRLLSQQAGYAKVYNVKDGIRAWIKENRPMTSAAGELAACRAAKSC